MTSFKNAENFKNKQIIPSNPYLTLHNLTNLSGAKESKPTPVAGCQDMFIV